MTQYSHMGLASQQFTPTNLASLLQGQQPAQPNGNNFQFYPPMNFQQHQ